MPTYCFRRGDGTLVELAMSCAELERRRRRDGSVLHDGEVLSRDVVAEHSATVGSSAGWPMASDAAAVHPSDVPRVREDLARRGASCGFTGDGRPIFESAAHRRAVLRLMRLHDRMGYD